MNLTRSLNKWLQKHLFLNAKPSTLWKIARFFIHWITLPIKLALIGGLGLFQIVRYSFKTPREVTDTGKRWNIFEIMANLPLLLHEQYTAYLPRQQFGAELNGRNHNSDHQCSRHGTLTFLATKIRKADEKIVEGMSKFMLGDYLARGFTIDDMGSMRYNTSSVSGDMLCGLALGVNALNEVQTDNSKPLQDKYERLISAIIRDDYALREYDGPMADDDGILPEIYQERLEEAGHDKFLVNMKSNRASWSAGIETVGAQALTVLAALRVADKKFNDPLARKHYKKLLWKYGYGLLSIFPTAYIDSRRGYFNDHNCMMALYVLAKNADHKWFWKLPMLYVWGLSRHWHNMYFDGLLLDAYPELKPRLANHIAKSKAYLSEVGSVQQMCLKNNDVKEIQTDNWPVPLNKIYDDEFYPDIRRDVYTEDVAVGNYHMAGLGFFGDVVMDKVISGL